MRLMELCVLQPPQRNTWQVWGGGERDDGRRTVNLKALFI